MMFNETFFGLVLHKQLKGLSNAFTYPEERPDFVVPENFRPGYKTRQRQERQSSGGQESGSNPSLSNSGADTPAQSESKQSPLSTEAEKQVSSHQDEDNIEGPPTSMTEPDPYLVDWYGEDDPDNPQAWSNLKKVMFTCQLMLLTTSVYMGSSIVSPGIPLIAEYFGVGRVPATLALTLFVLGYGVGPMIGLCAASEIPAIGRCIPYVFTLFLFVILQIPTALVSNIAGFMILRFLAGLVGSPPLATGGASVGDVFAPTTAPLALAMWGLSASAGPVLGPLIGGYASEAFGVEGWRWTIWPLLMLSGFTLILLTFSMPETSASNILYRRTVRLRQVTGNPHLRSKGELFSATMTSHEIVMMVFVRPFRLGIFEPIALSINLHIGMVYGVLYVWFEAFPIVFTETYGFSTGNSGLAFLAILVGNLITYGIYFLWFTRYYRPKLIASGGKLAPEHWLHPAMVGAFFLPLSLFAFGWTSNKSIHYMVPIVCSGLFSVGIFGLFTSGLNYLAVCYPSYVASVFSANDFLRALIGAALPLVADAMFTNLESNGPRAFPVAWGCTLMGCVSLALAPVPFLLYRYGPALRRASKYTENTPDEGKGEEKGALSSESRSQSDA
ncbi:hypothetical protein CBS101457_003469 [Exobasidium rhododendri]|nr:hypothetical protein CBS101457_003469 [Exobasidium rhododendri]